MPRFGMELVMKTRTLHALIQSLDEETRHLEAAALFASRPWQEDFFNLRVRQIATIVANIRHEILARGQPGKRDSAEPERFDEWLQRALEAHLGLDPEIRLESQRNAA